MLCWRLTVLRPREASSLQPCAQPCVSTVRSAKKLPRVLGQMDPGTFAVMVALGWQYGSAQQHSGSSVALGHHQKSSSLLFDNQSSGSPRLRMGHVSGPRSTSEFHDLLPSSALLFLAWVLFFVQEEEVSSGGLPSIGQHRSRCVFLPSIAEFAVIAASALRVWRASLGAVLGQTAPLRAHRAEGVAPHGLL